MTLSSIIDPSLSSMQRLVTLFKPAFNQAQYLPEDSQTEIATQRNPLANSGSMW
jgi:hypothetical protein